jgi:hypothetical protein
VKGVKPALLGGRVELAAPKGRFFTGSCVRDLTAARVGFGLWLPKNIEKAKLVRTQWAQA